MKFGQFIGGTYVLEELIFWCSQITTGIFSWVVRAPGEIPVMILGEPKQRSMQRFLENSTEKKK